MNSSNNTRPSISDTHFTILIGSKICIYKWDAISYSEYHPKNGNDCEWHVYLDNGQQHIFHGTAAYKFFENYRRLNSI